MRELEEKIRAFKPFNEQEEKDKSFMLEFIEKNPNCLVRCPSSFLPANAFRKFAIA